MAWNISKVESKSVVFVCAECGKISNSLFNCNKCGSQELVECTLIEDTPKYLRVDVEDVRLIIAMVANKLNVISSSDHRSYIVTIFKDSFTDMIEKEKGVKHSIGEISDFIGLWNKLHR
jgi:predicted RNA-binding Zn-ribbon protein involved in translation (DUF1610 family)